MLDVDFFINSSPNKHRPLENQGFRVDLLLSCYYSGGAGYSPDTAKSIGSENLTKPDIRAAVDKAEAERSRRTGINQDRVIREIAKLAFLNPVDVIDMDLVIAPTNHGGQGKNLFHKFITQ